MAVPLVPPGRLIDVGGFNLHVHSVGRGATVVLEAALAGSALSWTLVQPHVARFARAVAYDRAGFGWSDAGPLPRTAGRVADELRVLLDRAGERPPFVLVGHSFGGLVMRIFAHRYARDTRALVLVDPAHPEDWVQPAAKEQERIDKGVALCRQGVALARWRVPHLVAALIGAGAFTPARAIVRVATRGRFTRRDEGILGLLRKLPAEAQRPLRRYWSRGTFFEALGSQIETISTSAAEVIETAGVGYGDLPLVTISRTDPGDYRRAQQDRLAALSTRGRHVIADHSGHWVPLDEPELVVSVIRELAG